jgi:beta-galactosidase
MRPDDSLASATKGADGQPVNVAGRAVGRRWPVGTGSIVLLDDLGQPAAAIEAAIGSSQLLRFTRNDPRLDVAVHGSPTAGRLLVFVANPTAEPIDAEICVSQGVSEATELWEERRAAVSNGSITDRLDPYTIKIYACSR